MASKKSKKQPEKQERNVSLILYRAVFVFFTILIALAMIITAIG